MAAAGGCTAAQVPLAVIEPTPHGVKKAALARLVRAVLVVNEYLLEHPFVS